jgi:WD40 repeat protein/serine/threonine protein kinase
MTDPSVLTLVEALASSHVLEPEQVEELSALPEDDFPGPTELARELVRRGWATPYQLRLVHVGRGRELVLGQYVLLELLGEGGMGQVFKARHRRLDRVDALKVIRPERIASQASLARFLREARAIARLAHPNIVSIHAADECDGTHFLAMEYIPGIDFLQIVRRTGPLPAGFACHAIRQAALGLQHAHERGLVHRDIKPANLLLSEDQETVKVLDLGLARMAGIDADAAGGQAGHLTQSGFLVGTVDYMAPEQGVDPRGVDIRADVYSLGCTLYHFLAGVPPYPEGTVLQKLMWHQEREPQPLERYRPDLPPGLGDLCRKAMARRPDDRYQTPGELAAALAPFASTLEATEHRDTATAATLDGPRTPSPFAGGAERIREALRTSQVSLDEIDFVFDSRASTARSGARPVPTPSQAGAVPPSDPTLSGAAPAARLPPVSGTILEALPVEEEAGSKTLPMYASGAEKRKRKRSSGVKERPRVPRAKRREVRSVGLPALLGGGGVLLAVAVGCVCLVLVFRFLVPTSPSAGAARGDEIRVIDGHTDIVYGVAFSPDGKQGVSCGKDRTVRVWDLETGVLAARLEGFGGTVNMVAWSPTDRHLVLLGGGSPPDKPNHSVRLWDTDPGKTARQFRLEGHTTSVLCVAFSSDGKWALTGGGLKGRGDLALRLWDVKNREEAGRLQGHKDYIFRVAFSPDGKRAASAGNDRTLRVWDVEQRKELHCFEEEKIGGRVLSLAFSPEGRFLASGGEDHLIRLWDLDSWQETGQLRGHTLEAFGVAYLPDGHRLVSAGADRTLRVWDLEQRKETHQFKGHTDIITNLALSRDGTRALTCSQDKTVRLWELPNP